MKRFNVTHSDGRSLSAPVIVLKITEPYARQVFDLIKAHEKSKGTDDMPDTFEDFCKKLLEVRENPAKRVKSTPIPIPLSPRLFKRGIFRFIEDIMIVEVEDE